MAEEEPSNVPELPEVETMVRDLRGQVIGRTIVRADVYWDRLVGHPGVPAFRRGVKGRTISGVCRRGKFALFDLDDGGVLAVHRGMTGSILLRESRALPDRFVRARFRLDDGREMRIDDARKFGRLYWRHGNVRRTRNVAGDPWVAPWERLGMEPLDEEFTAAGLSVALARRNAAIKTILLNQSVVAGVGNIYADESLFLAGIHPQRPAASLNVDEVAALWASIVTILQTAIDGRGTTFLNYQDINGSAGTNQQRLMVFHRQPGPCDRCGGEIRKIVLGARGTHFCAGCQI